jgi:hypothetical protein
MFTALRKLWPFGAKGQSLVQNGFRHVPAPVAPGYTVKSASDPFRPRSGSDEDPGTSL